MINYTYESLFRQDSIDKQISITGTGINLDNTKIFQGSFELSESINTYDDLTFGSIVSSTLRFTTSAVESSFIGKTLLVKVTIDGNTNNPLTIGTYKVDEEQWTADRTKKEITAHDSLYDVINKDVAGWYNTLTFPITVKNFRNSFFSYVGITQKSVTLVNDSQKIYNSILPNTLSGGEVIRAICELNGCFGRITRDNKFEYKTLAITPVYSVTPSMYIECIYEDYQVAPIDKVIIRQEEDDIGGEAGTGDNPFIIEGNFLVYGNETSVPTIATNILNTVSAITYTPAEITLIGNPCVEVGDLISVTKRDGTSFTTYVLSRTLKNIQSMKDEYTATGNKTRANDINTIKSDWLQLLGKSNVLTRTLNGTISQVEELGNSVTTLSQTADSIQLQVNSLQEQVDGETQYYERNGEPTLLNYPYWDFTSAIPCNNTIRLDEIYTNEMLEGGSMFPHFYYSEQDRKNHLRALCVDMDNGNGYRFILENDVWYWKEIADSDWSILYNQIAEVKIDVEGIETNVSNMELDLSSLDNRVTTNTANINTTASAITAEVTRATQVEGNLNSAISSLSASISMTASGITTWVSENYTTTSTVSTMLEDYQTVSGMSSYQTVSGMSLYWTASQTSTKIAQSASAITLSVRQTYQPKSAMSSYQTVSGMSDYPTNSAMTNYVGTELADYSTTSEIARSYYNMRQTEALISVATSTITLFVEDNYYTSAQTDNRYPTKNQTTSTTNPNSLQSQLNVHTSEISAKVNKNSPTGQTNFSWEMTDSKMEWKKDGSRIMLLNSSGLEIKGKVQATEGFIGSSASNGFTIKSNAIYNGISSYSGTGNGIYIGTDGINVNNRFLASSSGDLIIKQGHLGNFEINNQGQLVVHNMIQGGVSYGKIYTEDDQSIRSMIIEGDSHLRLIGGDYGITLENVSAINNSNVPSNPLFTDSNVTQTAIATGDYRKVLLGGTSDDTERTSVWKTTKLDFNTSNSVLRIKQDNTKRLLLYPYALYFSNDACILNQTSQNLVLRASSETAYGVRVSVIDERWTLAPITDTYMYLGSPSRRWNQIYSNSSVISTSDRNEKKDITSLQENSKDFIMKLDPVSYKFKDGKRTHYGLISQDIEKVMKEMGMSDKDFAGFCKDEIDGEERYGLRYEEFISPLIKTVQMQQKEIEELRKKVGEWTN